MEEFKAYIELIIASAYSIHAAVEVRGKGDPHRLARGARQNPRISAEASCLIAVAVSYFAMAGVSLALGH